jgi:hypothetical protein
VEVQANHDCSVTEANSESLLRLCAQGAGGSSAICIGVAEYPGVAIDHGGYAKHSSWRTR